MSVDKSLKLRSTLSRQRSVLSRVERLAELTEVGKWKDGDSIFGLPKVRVRKAKRKVKAVKAEAAPGAAPAAGADAAKGAAAPAGKAPAGKPAAAAKPAAGKKA